MEEIYFILPQWLVMIEPATVSSTSSKSKSSFTFAFAASTSSGSAEECVTKRDEIVVKMKEYIDALYAEGRVTLMTDAELEEIFVSLSRELAENK